MGALFNRRGGQRLRGESMVGPMQAESLRSRILEALEKGYDKILLSDDYVAWTGQDVLARMRKLDELLETCTQPRAAVAVSFPNLAVQALAILTVIVSGRVPVILSSDVGNDLDQRLQMAQASILLTMTDVDDLSPTITPCVVLNADASIKATAIENASRAQRSAPHPASRGAALMLFTSGSTGRPKGIYVPEIGLLKTINFLSGYFDLGSSTRSPIVLPISHSMALNTQFLPTLLSGGTSYFMNAWLSIGRVYRSILLMEGTFVSLIGEVLCVCWEEKDRKGLPPAENVRHVQLAGGMMSDRHLCLARDLFPSAVLHKGYGLTEAIRVAMINSNMPNFTTCAVGKPLPFCDVEVRSRDAGRIELAGSQMLGEVFVRGDNVLLGTAGSTEKPVGVDGFLATGDLGYWNEIGQLCIAGRDDGVFKINGHRVSGFEIEQLALETSGLIRNAQCIAIEDTRRAGYKIVLLLEVPAHAQGEFLSSEFDDIPEKMWRKFQTLAHFPSEIMVLERFPRNDNGKVALSSLKETYLQSCKAAQFKISYSRLQFSRLRANEPNGHEA
jgi:acyl-CoA synthetase (AMP-forming)/AMP-acid ligase II